MFVLLAVIENILMIWTHRKHVFIWYNNKAKWELITVLKSQELGHIFNNITDEIFKKIMKKIISWLKWKTHYNRKYIIWSEKLIENHQVRKNVTNEFRASFKWHPLFQYEFSLRHSIYIFKVIVYEINIKMFLKNLKYFQKINKSLWKNGVIN